MALETDVVATPTLHTGHQWQSPPPAQPAERNRPAMGEVPNFHLTFPSGPVDNTGGTNPKQVSLACCGSSLGVQPDRRLYGQRSPRPQLKTPRYRPRLIGAVAIFHRKIDSSQCRLATSSPEARRSSRFQDDILHRFALDRPASHRNVRGFDTVGHNPAKSTRLWVSYKCRQFSWPWTLATSKLTKLRKHLVIPSHFHHI